MQIEEAIERVRLGESIAQISEAYRSALLLSMGLSAQDVGQGAFRKEARRFVNKLCRELGDRYGGDRKVAFALRAWVESVTDYEAWDALLSSFEFEGKARFIERGRRLFAGPMTAHWTS